MRILVLNGPNLNLLGQRREEVYGRETWAEIQAELERDAERLGVAIVFEQSNHEGGLIDALQRGRGEYSGVVLNPGGLAHTSVALRDAVADFGNPVVEVHMSNVAAREPFRHVALTGGAAAGVVSGFRGLGYRLALRALVVLLGGTL